MAGILQHLRSSTLDKRPNPGSMVDGQVAINYASGSPGLFFKDSAGALVKVGPVHVGTTAPNVSPASGGTAGNSRGEQWLDTSGGSYVMKIWDGSAWRTEAGEFVNATGDIMTGALGMPPASAGSPTIYFSGDTDTGLYSPGANQLAITTSGTGRLFVASDGKVGIGTNSPSELLHLASSASPAIRIRNTAAGVGAFSQLQLDTANSYNNGSVVLKGISENAGNNSVSFAVETSAVAGSPVEKFRITSDGNVGIGTSSPSAKTEIASSGSETSLILRNTSSAMSSYSELKFAPFTGTTAASAAIRVTYAQDNNSQIEFRTTNVNAEPVERLRITSDGKVAVGDVLGLGQADALQVAGRGLFYGEGSTGGVRVLNASAGSAGAFVANTGTSTGATLSATGPLVFEANGEKMRIDSSGRLLVGISTVGTNPGTNRVVIRDTANNGGLSLIQAATPTGSQGPALTFGAWDNNQSDAFPEYTARIQGRLKTGGVGNVTGELALQTWNSSSFTEAITIKADGGVGIGTSSPRGTLTIGTDVAASSTDSSLHLGYAPIDGYGYRIVNTNNPSNTSAGVLKIQRGLVNAWADVLLLDNTGNLVVGATSTRNSTATFVNGTSNTNADYGGNAASFVGAGNVGIGANAATITVEDNNSMNVGVGGSIGFGGRYISSNTSYAQWAAIAGKKETNVSGQYGGYLGFYTRTDGSAVIEERARIDSSGRLLVGTSSSITNAVDGGVQIVGTSADSYLTLTRFGGANASAPAGIVLGRSRSGIKGTNTAVSDGDFLGVVEFTGADGGTNYRSAAQIAAYVDGAVSGGGAADMPGRLVFSTTADGTSSPVERFRISNDGSFRFLTPDSVVVGAIKNSRNANGDQVLILQNGSAANNTSSYYLVCQEESVANRCFIYGNGNIANTNNSYGAISDLKLKENIVLASSQWNDIKALQVRKYNFKAGTGQPTHTQIGLIAQEVEEVSPGLVYESPDLDAENNDLGTVTKSVNYSVLYMKAVKALQEAMERIETLEAKVAALEAA